eukprot:TRINITY_DN6286_c0_g2_i1.p2 TRINITY_DN6286_c0_g2~~TRINITY_DN6286_c0_g2_i1.p2  ORF type:complete len:129 (+),score=3.81 TRINITY_DN6286_c0_g2_i1:332-718(+)
MHDQLGPFSNTSSRWHGLAGTETGQREAQGRGRGVEHRDKHEGGSAEGGHRHEGGCRGGHLHSGLDGHRHRNGCKGNCPSICICLTLAKNLASAVPLLDRRGAGTSIVDLSMVGVVFTFIALLHRPSL